jgi:hypothetical protein
MEELFILLRDSEISVHYGGEGGRESPIMANRKRSRAATGRAQDKIQLQEHPRNLLLPGRSHPLRWPLLQRRE